MAVSAVKKEPAKPRQSEPAPALEAEAATPAPSGTKSKKKLLFIALALAVLGGGGGGSAWWYMHRDAGSAAHKVEPAKPPVFAPLDMFTVNLQPEDGQQFAQVGLTLRVIDEAAVAALKLHMPEIRDRILLMLSAKKPSELMTVDGKRKLSGEIQAAVNEILAPGAAKAQQEAPKAAPAPAAAAPEAAAQAETPPAPTEPAVEAPAAAEAPVAAEAPAAAQEPAAAEATPAPALPVTGVLFTSFIIQ